MHTIILSTYFCFFQGILPFSRREELFAYDHSFYIILFLSKHPNVLKEGRIVRIRSFFLHIFVSFKASYRSSGREELIAFPFPDRVYVWQSNLAITWTPIFGVVTKRLDSVLKIC